MARVEGFIARGQDGGDFRTDLPHPWLMATFYSLMHGAAEEVDTGRLEPGEAWPPHPGRPRRPDQVTPTWKHRRAKQPVGLSLPWLLLKVIWQVQAVQGPVRPVGRVRRPAVGAAVPVWLTAAAWPRPVRRLREEPPWPQTSPGRPEAATNTTAPANDPPIPWATAPSHSNPGPSTASPQATCSPRAPARR